MPFWIHTIELGNASVVFPLAIAIALAAICRRDYASAAIWLSTFGIGVLLIVTCKFAFDFGGYALADIDLYNVSGHAMLTTALYPVLLGALANHTRPRRHTFAVGGGLGIAALMAIVLVVGRFHTVSETLLGASIGLVVARINMGRFAPMRWLPAGIALVAIAAAAMVMPDSVRVIRHRLWASAGAWFGVPGHYARVITRDPATGSTVVTIRPPRKLPAVSSKIDTDAPPIHIKPSL